ncbi:DUF1566 domain-containing protein [Maribacter arcticus]|nr:DUF1566 domain-containing protein [Maribacter arcticus]MDA9089694.1 DUF1566 domain-containing protein [Maribacter arcticus]
MKNNYAILVAIFIVATSFAQTPEKMTSQAIVRDAAGDLVTNQQVGMQISILQTTVGGTAVYVETQTPTTNASGLLSIAIGTGAVVTGVYATIDWSADTYFIKTETDPTGGTSYSIMGTSQILSVPYALYANSAATVITASNGTPTGGTEGQVLQMVEDVPTWVDASFSIFYKDTDGDGYGDVNNTILAGAAPNGYVTNNTDCNDGDATMYPTAVWYADLDGDGYGDATSSETGCASTLTNATQDNTDCNDGDPTVNPGQSEIYSVSIDNNCDGIINETYAIGDFTAGGVVFYIASPPVDLDGDGDLDNGLVAAVTDQSAGIQWYNEQYIETGATGIAIGTGASNTNAIIAAQGATETAYAAGLARAYRGGGFNDWFLPSQDELNLMNIHKVAINATVVAHSGVALALDYYWSSSENGFWIAWSQVFTNGTQSNDNKYGTSAVRAVRAF